LKEFEKSALRDAYFLSLSISSLSLREAKLSLGEESFDQGGMHIALSPFFDPR
jgi:hypothetical protein